MTSQTPLLGFTKTGEWMQGEQGYITEEGNTGERKGRLEMERRRQTKGPPAQTGANFPPGPPPLTAARRAAVGAAGPGVEG